MGMRRPKKKCCNGGLILDIGLLVATLLPGRRVVGISAVVICILSLFAFKY